MNRRLFLVPVVAFAALIGVAGCSSSPTPSNAGSTPSATVSVVASTNVYGGVAKQIGGDHVSVTSIIDNPNQDPHEFEADARSQLEISKADLVIENGGGYDDFMSRLLSASGNDAAIVLNVAEISGYGSAATEAPVTSEFNEHLWYDLPTIEKLADRLADSLTTLQPDAADVFESNKVRFADAIDDLEQSARELGESNRGVGILVTEPLPLYLTAAVGLVDKTPRDFSHAMEAGTGVPPSALRDALELIRSNEVQVVIFNQQTANSQVEALLVEAETAGVPVVPMAETIPADTDYVDWMRANLTALTQALQGDESA